MVKNLKRFRKQVEREQGKTEASKWVKITDEWFYLLKEHAIYKIIKFINFMNNKNKVCCMEILAFCNLISLLLDFRCDFYPATFELPVSIIIKNKIFEWIK